MLNYSETGDSAIQRIFPIDFQWQTFDPFLFCAYHRDIYPEGNDQLGTSVSLEGRNLGMDFDTKDGFRMYHGTKIPGFPVHPHRGFETVTIVREGLVDHADSLGAAGRYGEGDVQWMTAGAGLQHSEMFPLLHKDKKNATELFQVWLNLPKAKKFAKPHFKMFWANQIPKYELDGVRLEVVSGQIANLTPPAPPPDSWASDSNNQVAIWIIVVEKGGKLTIPKGASDLTRCLYFHAGSAILAGGKEITSGTGILLDSNKSISIENRANETARFLMLQGKPIAEPIVQRGPFVMNTNTEITQAIQDYQKTQFGGWPWHRQDMVHSQDQGRFALFPDGHREEPT